MPDELSGFAYRRVRFGKDGALADPADERALTAAPRWSAMREVIVFSHGWNNDQEEAEHLYERFLGHLRTVLGRPGSRPASEIGVVGVIWPSKLWADDGAGGGGGAAALDAPPSDAQRVRHLKGAFDAPGADRTLAKMGKLLEEQPADADALRRFHALLAELMGDPEESAPEDVDDVLLTEDPLKLFERLGTSAAVAAPADQGGAAGVGDAFGSLWSGAREALRSATYWQMKARAGRVGREGLGPLIARWWAAVPDLRVHLIGHSFGARLVSYSLAGLAPAGPMASSPIGSLLMLQGAFSHYAFTAHLPQRDGHGALAGLETRVDGPIVVTHTLADLALANLYTTASLAAGDDAAAVADRLTRWGAMGHDGAQDVDAGAAMAGPVGTAYALTRGAFVNVDCNAVIRTGGGAAGAHSDLFHPELAWIAALSAGFATT